MEPLNGLYGHVYDENGNELDTTQEFSSQVEYNKAEYNLPGQFMTKSRVMTGKGTGSVTYLKKNSGLVKKIAENPQAKYNYIGKLADPTANGEEAVLYRGVSFDGAPLQNHTLGENVEVELNFTFDDYKYLDFMP